jgi:hypothetical protein
MIRITLKPATVARLQGLREPVEFCDESGLVLGIFTPTVRDIPFEGDELIEVGVSEEQHLREVEASLGEALGVYGYEKDLE